MSSHHLTIKQKGELLFEKFFDHFLFFLEFLKDPVTNGSMAPSSPDLTRKIIQYIPKKEEKTKKQRHYLEVGPGTGVFSIGIIQRLKPRDHLDIVEKNPSYCKTLKKKFARYKNVHIYCLSITDWKPNYQYDHIISGLPLNGFSPEFVQECLKSFIELTKNNGLISYFEYETLSKILLKITFGKSRHRLKKVLEIKHSFFQTYGFQQETVKENSLSANVLHFKINNKSLAYGKTNQNTIT